MLTDKPYASTPDGLRFDPRFLTAPGAWDEFELPLDLADPAAPTEDASLLAPVGEPGLAAPPEPLDEAVDSLPTLSPGPDGFEIMATLAGVLDSKLFDGGSASPLPQLELSPTAGRELAAANDGGGQGSVDFSSTLSAISALLGGMNMRAVGDRFSFESLASDEELARADDSPLDPFMDAIDPAWMGEIMATLLPDGTMLLPDGTITFGLPTDTLQDPMAEIPVDGPDGWVV